MHRGEVRGQHHVGPPLEDMHPVGERARRPAKVGLSDHVVDQLSRRIDVNGVRSELSHPPANAQVRRQRAGHQTEIHPGRRADPDRSDTEEATELWHDTTVRRRCINSDRALASGHTQTPVFG